jgi:hypothetical protein
MRFTTKDQEQAVNEGWAIFNRPERGEIQRDDEAAVFASDEEAIAFVTKSALGGSGFHARALTVHLATIAGSGLRR